MHQIVAVYMLCGETTYIVQRRRGKEGLLLPMAIAPIAAVSAR